MRFSFLLLLFFLIISVGTAYGQPEGISTIAWNGGYFLIGTFDGSIVKYDGEKFSLLENFNKKVLDIEYNKNYWIIGGREILAKYDGKKFEILSYSYNVEKIRCNGKYCLILTKKEGINNILILDNTNTLRDMTPIGLKQTKIKDFLWNGKYWLINAGNCIYILKYDKDEKFKKLALPDSCSIASMGRNGEYWLIACICNNSNLKFFKYNESHLQEIETQQLLNILRTKTKYLIPTKICWNDEGKYWLIGAEYKIIKYNGTSFEEVETHYRSGQILYVVKDMEWNGKYWLIAYTINPPSGGGSIAKYDGVSFIELTNMPSSCIVSKMVWNGEYWLIGTFKVYCDRWALLKYNGTVFTDLTKKFPSSRKIQKIKFVVIVMIIGFLILINRRKKKTL